MSDNCHIAQMNSRTKINSRESLRLDKDVQILWQAAMRKLGSRNKNRVANECLREYLRSIAPKGLMMPDTNLARRLFGTE